MTATSPMETLQLLFLSWLIQGKTAALEFTTRTLRQAMARCVNRTVKNRLWCILDLQDLLLRLTFDNICGLTFGKDPQTLSPENTFAMAFDTATETTLYRLLYPGLLWRWDKILGIENYMNGAIEARKEAPSDDLLSRFVKKRDFPSPGLEVGSPRRCLTGLNRNVFDIWGEAFIAWSLGPKGGYLQKVTNRWLFGGNGILANEVSGLRLRCGFSGSWTQGGAQDVSHSVYGDLHRHGFIVSQL
ncbi:hypothetical protein V6N13_145247 [Hibiscus sabdariffa]|uniref:Uncharacterized protein n=1 Tax=Hibiscus sabdariffa TaxID=183260 RepID=A0ABR2FMW4_9ROSI